jgi:hypothetical protein
MNAYRTIAIDANLRLAASQTVSSTGGEVGEVGGQDVYLQVLPGMPYMARIEMTSFNTGDGDEVYTFDIEEASATGFGTILNKHTRRLTAAQATGSDVYNIGFVPDAEYVRLKTTTTGTSPQAVISLAHISALK